MKLKQLLNLYPQASVQQQPQNSDTYLSIKVDNQWLILPKKGLSSTEIQLLQIFSNTSDIPQSLNQRKHPWADFRRWQSPYDKREKSSFHPSFCNS